MPTIKRLKKKTPPQNSVARKDRIKIYNSARWRRIREVKLMTTPLCERCAEVGRVSSAEDVHHMVSFMSTDDPEKRLFLAYDYSNLQSLCKKCHQEIHNSNEYRKEKV